MEERRKVKWCGSGGKVILIPQHQARYPLLILEMETIGENALGKYEAHFLRDTISSEGYEQHLQSALRAVHIGRGLEHTRAWQAPRGNQQIDQSVSTWEGTPALNP